VADLLRVDDVSMRFGGVQALVGVSSGLAEGEALGLVGPNGAGKTTLFDCICGRIRPSSGSVAFAGVCIDGMPTYRRARMGIGRTFQRLEVIPSSPCASTWWWPSGRTGGAAPCGATC